MIDNTGCAWVLELRDECFPYREQVGARTIGATSGAYVYDDYGDGRVVTCRWDEVRSGAAGDSVFEDASLRFDSKRRHVLVLRFYQ